jgi:hypothetical protein
MIVVLFVGMMVGKQGRRYVFDRCNGCQKSILQFADNDINIDVIIIGISLILSAYSDIAATTPTNTFSQLLIGNGRKGLIKLMWSIHGVVMGVTLEVEVSAAMVALYVEVVVIGTTVLEAAVATVVTVVVSTSTSTSTSISISTSASVIAASAAEFFYPSSRRFLIQSGHKTCEPVCRREMRSSRRKTPKTKWGINRLRTSVHG